MPEESKTIYESPHRENTPPYIRCVDRAGNKGQAIHSEFSALQTELLQCFPDCFPGAIRRSKRGAHLEVTEAYFLVLFNENPAQVKLEMIVYTPDSNSPKELTDKYPQGHVIFELHTRYHAGGTQERVYKDNLERFARMHNLQRIERREGSRH